MEMDVHGSNVPLGVVTEKGVYFDLMIEKSDHQLLRNDKKLLKAEWVLEKYLSQVKDLPFPDDSCKSLKLDGWGLKPFVPYMANPNGKLRSLGSKGTLMEDDEETNPSEWNRKNCSLLIRLVDGKQELFVDASVRRGAVWNDIATEMRENGYFFTGELCSKKWSNLKVRYFQLLKAKEREPDGFKTRWPFFKEMKAAVERLSTLNETYSQSSPHKMKQENPTLENENSGTETGGNDIDKGSSDIGDNSLGPVDTADVHIETDHDIDGREDSNVVIDSLAENFSEGEQESTALDMDCRDAKVDPEISFEIEDKLEPDSHTTHNSLYSSKRRNQWSPDIPEKYRGLELAFRRESRKTRKVIKKLIKQQKKSASLLQQFLLKLGDGALIRTEKEKGMEMST